MCATLNVSCFFFSRSSSCSSVVSLSCSGKFYFQQCNWRHSCFPSPNRQIAQKRSWAGTSVYAQTRTCLLGGKFYTDGRVGVPSLRDQRLTYDGSNCIQCVQVVSWTKAKRAYHLYKQLGFFKKKKKHFIFRLWTGGLAGPNCRGYRRLHRGLALAGQFAAGGPTRVWRLAGVTAMGRHRRPLLCRVRAFCHTLF